MSKFGIDVSDYQGKIDWTAVKGAGIEFAILRTVRGSLKPDNYFEANYKGCTDNGIPVGAYKYSYALTVEDAKKEATAVLQLLGGRPLDLPVFFDAEDKTQRALPKSLLTQIIRTFLDIVSAGGYRVGIYCNLDWYKHVVDVSAFPGVDFWVAQYGKNTGKADPAYKPNVGEIGWQYTSKGSVPGINGNVDLDFLYKDYGQAAGPAEKGETMTEAQARQRIVDIATKWVGQNSVDGTHKPLIDLYNIHMPLARGYKVKYTDAWCAVTVSAAAIMAGYTDIIPTECGCPQMIELFKKMGRWQENDAYVPKPGDVIFYDWQDTGVGDNTGVPDHVGIVASVSGLSIKVIEGNLNGAVGYRTMCVNGRYIRGYGVPNYASKAGQVSAPPSEPSASGDTYKPHGTYQNGSTAEPVYSSTGTAGTYIGSLDPYEKCDCLGIVDNMAMVLYRVNGTSRHKVGFVNWLGGVKK